MIISMFHTIRVPNNHARFPAVYDDKTLQETLFRNEIQPVLQNAFRGINTTIFAYGHTGAGIIISGISDDNYRENVHNARKRKGCWHHSACDGTYSWRGS